MLEWQGRGFLNVNVLAQTQSRDFSNAGTFELYEEAGSSSSTQEIGSGAVFDVMGGVRVWSNLAIGVGFSRLSRSDDVQVDASVPHPLFFDQARAASASLDQLEHTERSVHVLAVWLMPIDDRFDVSVFAGPSFFTVNQEVANDVSASNVNEAGAPFTSVMLQGVTATKFDESTVGFTAGADVTYMFTESVGAGGVIRYSGASADLEAAGGRIIPLDLGGFQIGGGIRVRF